MAHEGESLGAAARIDTEHDDSEIKDIMAALDRDEQRLGPGSDGKPSEAGDTESTNDHDASNSSLPGVDISSMMLVDVSGLNRLIQSLYDSGFLSLLNILPTLSADLTYQVVWFFLSLD